MKKLSLFLEKKAVLIMILAIVAYFFTFSFFCLWKYYNFQYDLLDLGIINQVFFNTVNGDWFASTIHPPSYLGDHFTPILLLILPLYLIYQSPVTLLLIQTLILALCAWPIYLLAKNILNTPRTLNFQQKISKENNTMTKNKIQASSSDPMVRSKSWGLFFALMFLANPLVANINLFEFHFLPFAIFTLLWAIYFYYKNDFWKFLIFIFLSLLVREDVSLVVFMFGILALFDKRKLKWILTPMVMSGLYFFISLKIINIFWPAGNYKFMIYYAWLGNSWPELITNALLKIDKVVLHFLTLGNVEMILGLLLPFALLPLLAPKFLILTLLVFIQFILGEAGGSAIIVKTHYSSLFIPALFASTIMTVRKFQTESFKFSFFKFLQKEKALAVLTLTVTIIYTSIFLGPIFGTLKQIYQKGVFNNDSFLKNEMIKKIDATESVVASYGESTNLTSRKNIYSLHYIYMGYQQFSDNDYVLEDPVDAMIIDYRNLFTFYLQYQDKLEKGEEIKPDNLNKLIEDNNLGVVEFQNGIALYKKDIDDQFNLYKTHDKMPAIDYEVYKNLENIIEFLGYNISPDGQLKTFWQKKQNIEKDYFVRVNSNDIFLPAYGLYPIKDWQLNEIVQMNFKFDEEKNNSQITLEIVEVEGGVILSGARSTQNAIKTKTLGQPIQIQLSTN